MTSSPDAPNVAPARTAVVTGAGRGIGARIARGLAASGYRLALLGRTEDHLRDTAARIADEVPDGPEVELIAVDLIDPAAVREAARAAEQALGTIDLLVQNAGVIEHAELPFGADDVEDMWRVVETNVRGPMLLAHALLPGMLAAGGARIVHINSGSGYRAAPTYTGYHVSKGALARLTTQLDAQYRERGLLVFDVAPGVVATDMTAAMPTHDDRTQWTPVERVVELVVGVGAGELDALAGRFMRAGSDTVVSLREQTPQILAADARRLTLATWGEGDPLR